MNSLTKRKIKEQLKFIRPIVISSARAAHKSKAIVSNMCRSVPPIRRSLNLPSTRVYSWQNWLAECADAASEIKLDTEKLDLSYELPETNESEIHWLFRQHQIRNVQGTFVASIKNGYAWGHNGGCYFNHRGDLLRDLGKDHWLNYNTPFSKSRLRFPKPIKIDSTVAVVAHVEAYSTYGHFLFDVSPKFGLLSRAGYTPDKIDFYAVGYRQLSYQKEVLAKAGISPDKIIPFEPNTYLQASNLLVPFLSTYWYSTHQKSTLDYVRWLGGMHSPNAVPDRMLFISRADASFRRLNQEEQIRPVLEEMGFEFVTLKDISIEDTAKLFSSAKIVVAPYGSGLMNIVFCRPGTKVLEIVGPSCIHDFHWHLAEECGLQHHYFMGLGKSVPEGGPLLDITKDIDVDIKELLSYITAMIGDYHMKDIAPEQSQSICGGLY